MPVFLPTIIKEMGYDTVSAQALSAPPYIVSFFTVLTVAYLSDRRQSRSPFIITMALLAAAGYTTSLAAGILGLPSWIRYLAIYPACMGFFTCVTLVITWTLNNQDSETKKGVGIAMLQFFGQCGPLLGTRLYPAEDGPLYIKGMAVCAGFMVLVALLAFVLRIILARENARRLREAEMNAIGEELESSAPLVGHTHQKPRDSVFLFIL
jgi:MFS family permease